MGAELFELLLEFVPSCEPMMTRVSTIQTNEIILAFVVCPFRRVNHAKIRGIKNIPIPKRMPTDLSAAGAFLFGLPQFGQAGAESDISLEQSEQVIIGMAFFLLRFQFLLKIYVSWTVLTVPLALNGTLYESLYPMISRQLTSLIYRLKKPRS